ncbi:MAG: hypothetical protein ACPLXP_00050 [Microgenomates group bacterium]
MDDQQIFKKIKGGKKLSQACWISDFLRELAIENIKENLRKKATPRLIQKELQKRLPSINY